MIATVGREPRNESDPVSPINIFAGGALYQRNPKHDPKIAPQKMLNSPTLEIYGIFKYSAKIILPTK